MLAGVRDLCRVDSARFGGTDGKLIGALGRYESLTPFEIWLCENVDALADETTGSTEWGRWIARIGKRAVETDDRGFWYVERFASERECKEAFDAADARYGEWSEEEDY